MSRIFTIYIDDRQDVSESLLGLLCFIDYSSGQWVRDETNSATVDDLVHALTDIGYKWTVKMDYETPYESGIRHFTTLKEWSEWYEN